MKIINNVDDFKSLKSIDLEDIKTTKINDLKRKDEAKTRIMKYITYKKRTEQEVRKKFKNEIDEGAATKAIYIILNTNLSHGVFLTLRRAMLCAIKLLTHRLIRILFIIMAVNITTARTAPSMRRTGQQVPSVSC